jgi:hypothetical protein
MTSRHPVETIIPMSERKPGVPSNCSPVWALYPQIPRLTMNMAAKKAASLAKETPRFGSDGDTILSTSDGSEDGDDSDRQKPNKTNALDSKGNPYQTRTYLLIDPHNGRGTCSAETEGYGEGDGEDGCEPGEADRFALGFMGRRRCAHGELLTADS